MSFKLRKGDKVQVLAGKDKGKTGKVLFVYPKKNRALVQGINTVKKHVRKSQQNPEGGLISKEVPIQLSNLAVICPVSGKPTRFSTTVAKDGTKQRISVKQKAVIS